MTMVSTTPPPEISLGNLRHLRCLAAGLGVLPKPISNRRRLLGWAPVTHLFNGNAKVPVKERYIIQIVPEVSGDVAHTLRNIENCTTRRNHRQRRNVWL